MAQGRGLVECLAEGRPESGIRLSHRAPTSCPLRQPLGSGLPPCGYITSMSGGCLLAEWEAQGWGGRVSKALGYLWLPEHRLRAEGARGLVSLLVPHLADMSTSEEPRSAELSMLCVSGEWYIPRGSATSVGSEGCLWEEVDWPRKPFMMF